MNNNELKAKIGNLVEGLTFPGENPEILHVEVPKDALKELMQKLRDKHGFDYLFALTGIDFGEELGVTYHLESTKTREMLQITVKTADRENPVLDSIFEIYPAALYNEMEAYDFFGITFKGHPNLKRLFLVEDFIGYPLRKDFTDEVNMLIR